jgi:hypothetical protein
MKAIENWSLKNLSMAMEPVAKPIADNQFSMTDSQSMLPNFHAFRCGGGNIGGHSCAAPKIREGFPAHRGLRGRLLSETAPGTGGKADSRIAIPAKDLTRYEKPRRVPPL